MAVSRLKTNIIKPEKIIFYITICFLITHLQSFKYFRAYNLLSDYILLVTDEGIQVYDPQLDECRLLTESNLITENDIDYIKKV